MGAHTVAAQQKPNVDARRFRLAQTFQRLNQHQRAIPILEQLYQSHPGNVLFYNALLQSYLELSKTAKALQLIQRQKQTARSNPRYDIDYANVLFRAGQKEQAFKIWHDLLKAHADNLVYYTLVANGMSANNLFDEAIGVYRQAAARFPQKTYLLQNIANLYRMRLLYFRALKFYLDYLKQEPRRFESVARQVLSFHLTNQQKDSLIILLKDARKRSGNNPDITRLLARVLQKYRKYGDALNLYKKLETKKTRGRYLLEFAQKVQADSLYREALKAYETLFKEFPKSPHLFSAYLGAARCHLELARRRNDQEHARLALQMIDRVERIYPDAPSVGNLELLRGQIYQQFFFDLDRAIAVFEKVTRLAGRDKRLRNQAMFNAGESFIMQGNPDSAAARLRKINDGKLKSRALFKLARLEFFRGNYKKSRDYLNKLMRKEGLSGDYTNDILSLEMNLNLEKTAPAALKYFARAEWLIEQQKKSEAIKSLKQSLQQNPPPDFRAMLLLRSARLSREMKNYEDAVSFCKALLDNPDLQMYADEALFITASIFDANLKDPGRAFKLYDRLLVEFPDSRYASISRDRLKVLQKELPENIQ